MDDTLRLNTASDDGDTQQDVSMASDTLGTSQTKLLQHNEHKSLEGSMQVARQDSGYNSSGSSASYSPGGARVGGLGDGEIVLTRSRASSRSSISSIPDSTLTNLPNAQKSTDTGDSQDYMLQSLDRSGPRAAHTLRQRDVSFRRPSSVRAMQMHTEDEGDDYFHLTPPMRRGSGRASDISIRSAGSSPFKRSPFYSPTGTAAKLKVKKEYPLVLLHCTLLSPSLPVSGLMEHRDRQKILKETLPPPYWKRWKLLEEKLGSGVLRERGVLISHPEDMYDLLEERLLESLELQHPRLDHGHFLGRVETDSDKEDRLAREDSSTEDEGEECPDCGGRFVRQNTIRKWDVKVFAANGLMRAGAWAAAWKEMEKVDVEVGLWLPSDVRAGLEKRLAEEASHSIQNELAVSLLQEPESIPVEPPVRALPPRLPSNASDLSTQAHVTPYAERPPSPFLPKVTPRDEHRTRDPAARKLSDEIDLQTLLVNYIRVLASDPRNITIVFLSVLVTFIAVNYRSAVPASDLRPFPRFIPEHPTLSVVAPQEPATQTSVENWNFAATISAVSDASVVFPSTAPDGALSGMEGSSDALVGSPAAETWGASPRESNVPSLDIDNLNHEYGASVSQKQPVQAIENEEGPMPSAAENIDTASEVKREPMQSTQDEPSEPLSTESQTLPAESADLVTEEQELPVQFEEIELENPLQTEINIPTVESPPIVFEEEYQPNQTDEDEIEEPLPTLMEFGLADSNEVASGEELLQNQEQPNQRSTNELHGLLPITIEAPSGEDALVVLGDKEQEDEQEKEEPSPAIAEALSLDSDEMMIREEESLPTSVAAPLKEAVCTVSPFNDISFEQAPPADAQNDGNDQYCNTQDQQNEQHESNTLHEHHDENDLYDM